MVKDSGGVQKSFGKGALWAGVIALLLIALIYGCARASQDEGGGRQGSRLLALDKTASA